MSLHLIHQFQNKVAEIIRRDRGRRGSDLRPAFRNLLEGYGAGRRIELCMELAYRTPTGRRVYPEGTLRDNLRQDRGYWVSKDSDDRLDDEIRIKLAMGYPSGNSLFEDGQTAVLIQNGLEAGRASMDDDASLHALLVTFVGFEPTGAQAFREGFDRFKADLPDLIRRLRRTIEERTTQDPAFAQASDAFLALCREAINAHLTRDDVQGMLVQHILTDGIFDAVFPAPPAYRDNPAARAITGIGEILFTDPLRHEMSELMAPFVSVIKNARDRMTDIQERQSFLKVISETVCRALHSASNQPMIIHTPAEIVRFMIESTEYLLRKHFGLRLSDRYVEILDPAAGTGAFITGLVEHLPEAHLPYKYGREIHCNEGSILPYGIAHRSIPSAYSMKMGHDADFRSLCFTDALDNLGFGGAGRQDGFDFTRTQAENLERIKIQNARPVSVIISQPPSGASPSDEAGLNRRRGYPGLDRRIRETYVRYSNAQKLNIYDMHTRYFRWASDRLDKNGIVAFVSPRAYIDARIYDGVRKALAEEFNEIHVIDLAGDTSPAGDGRRREGGSVGGDPGRPGALYFLVRKEGAQGCRIFHTVLDDATRFDDRKAALRENRFWELSFERIMPDRHQNWINLPETSWQTYIPVCDKESKLAKDTLEDRTLFKRYALGVSTNRDDWVYDRNPDTLGEKIRYFIERFNEQAGAGGGPSRSAPSPEASAGVIKWSETLKQRLARGQHLSFDPRLIIRTERKPFARSWYYAEKGLSDRLTSNHFDTFGHDLHQDNVIISFSSGLKGFNVLASKHLVDLHFIGDSQCLPLYRYDRAGCRHDNVTDWALKQFQTRYNDPALSRLDIFQYVYAVLHHPAYRHRFELNLHREFPRIPFYEDFRKWRAWGEGLLDLHLNYETAPPYPLERIELAPAEDQVPLKGSPILKADPAGQSIALDGMTTLKGIPPAVWEYRLGSRSALEWLLEYHRERKPKDPTIRDQFDTYRFADHKEEVIGLLQRACTVSIETVHIVKEMEGA